VAPVEKFVSYDPQFSYTYNADTGNVNLYTLPSPTSPYERGQSADDVKQVIEKMDTFTTQKKTLSNSKYLATNAFGAKTVVNKTVSTNVGIAANKIPFLKFEREIIYDTQDSQAIIAHQFKMNNTEAATELPALKVLIVMKLTAPYIVYDLSRFEPTRDIPIDSTVMERYLTGDVLGIVYYSGRTGHIFARLPENFGISTPDTTPNDKQNL
jgi:hypothetical protein